MFFPLEKLSTKCRTFPAHRARFFSLWTDFSCCEVIFHSSTSDAGWKKQERSSCPNQISHSWASLSSPFDPLNLVTKSRFFRHSKIYDGKELFSSLRRWRSIKDLRSWTLDEGIKKFSDCGLNRSSTRSKYSLVDSELKMNELWYAPASHSLFANDLIWKIFLPSPDFRDRVRCREGWVR